MAKLRHQQPILESLPEDVLYIILDQAPNLRYASRRLHGLAENLDRHALLISVSSSHEEALLDSIIRNPVICNYLQKYSYSVSDYDISNSLTKSKTTQTPSSRALLSFLDQEYCFFSPKQVVTPLPSIEIEHVHLPSDSEDPEPYVLATGVWKHITGTKYAASGTCMYASNVHWLMLKYSTRLAPGRYAIYIRIKTPNAFRLASIRFSVRENPNVKQNFAPFPPGHMAVGAHECLSNVCDIYMGDIVVSASNSLSDSQPGTWPLVEFEVEDNAVGCQRETQFSHLYFVRKQPLPEEELSMSGLVTPPLNDWEIILGGLATSNAFISPEMAAAYEELNNLKTLNSP